MSHQRFDFFEEEKFLTTELTYRANHLIGGKAVSQRASKLAVGFEGFGVDCGRD